MWKKIPLTRALRAESRPRSNSGSTKRCKTRERELRATYESRLEEDLQRAQADAAKKAEKRVAQELAGLNNQVKDQAKDLERLDASNSRCARRSESSNESSRSWS